MPSSAPPRIDRRQDRRLTLAARVRVVRRDGGAGTTGDLLDVSAGGIRVPAEALSAGDDVDVEIRMREGGRSGPESVQLRGRGIVVRVDSSDAPSAAIRFTTPLDMREPFAQLLLF